MGWTGSVNSGAIEEGMCVRGVEGKRPVDKRNLFILRPVGRTQEQSLNKLIAAAGHLQVPHIHSPR